MFYRIKNDQVYDYADYRYTDNCLQIEGITQDEYTKHPQKVIIQDGELVFNPDWDEIELNEAKEAKYQEALIGAKDYIENVAVFQFDENNSIEATDGNIGKMTANAFGLAQGAIQSVTWTSKEDNVLILNAEDVARILFGLGAVQAEVWNVKFVAYKSAIDSALTIEEVEAIVIDYESEE